MTTSGPPIARVEEGSKVVFGIMFIYRKKFPVEASRLGIHLYHSRSAVEIAYNVSIVETNERGQVIPGTLTCYHNDVCDGEDRIVCLLNISQGSKYNKCFSCRFKKADFDAADKVYQTLDYDSDHSISDYYMWIIGRVLGKPNANANGILETTGWDDITPIETKFPGANWTINGVIPIHDPRFGVVGENGHPPYAITDVEREKDSYCEIYDRYDELLGKYNEMKKRHERSQEHLVKITNMLSIENDE